MAPDPLDNTRPARIAMVGCGSVAMLYYTQALRRLEQAGRVRVAAAFDPDLAALSAFARSFGNVSKLDSYGSLLRQPLDLVILASPPAMHAQQAIEALGAGIAVHCEKPLAVTVREGELMVEAAVRSGRPLSVGLIRRQFASTRALREFFAAEFIGRLTSVEAFEGGQFDWPVRSTDYFTRAQSGGGVLQDIGTHVLDLLAWWFGEPEALVYEDDAMGGVEANCLIGLTFHDFTATVRLSRDWAQPNRYFFQGKKGWLAWTANDANRISFGLTDSELAADLALHAQTNVRGAPQLGAQSDEFHHAFEAQLDTVLNALQGRAPAVSAVDALAALRLVQRCYAERSPMTMSWMLPARTPQSLT